MLNLKMWGFLPATTSPYPKQGPLLKGGCKASFHMMGAHFLPQLPGKQFPDFINRKNVGAPPRIITSAPEKMETEEHSSPENREAPKTTPIVNNKACNKKKRKKKPAQTEEKQDLYPANGDNDDVPAEDAVATTNAVLLVDGKRRFCDIFSGR
jgi:hypothetical protein